MGSTALMLQWDQQLWCCHTRKWCGHTRLDSSRNQMNYSDGLDYNEDGDEDFMEDHSLRFMHDPSRRGERWQDSPPDTADTVAINDSEIKLEICEKTGRNEQSKQVPARCISHLIQRREHGLLRRTDGFSQVDCRMITSNFLPNKKEVVATLGSKAFCGTYSQNGDIFLSGCQDRYMRIYDTTRGGFRQFQAIQALDIGWSVLDTAFSPDGNFFVYSSWSNYLHLCNVYGESRTQVALNFDPESDHSFCIFSVVFSQDNHEIMGGANDRCLYVFDRELNQRTLRIEAHEDDVNAVAFADEASQILFSGSDDGLCKVWDRRTLRELDPKPVGVLAGHLDGVTFIDSKGDGRYLISNCKDQSIKLWDIRKFSPQNVQEATRKEVRRQNWDYRWQQVPPRVCRQRKKIEGDSSLMTYRGHTVLNTLVRCRFSPIWITGQQYIYTGCAEGAVVVYDVLTGKIVTRLVGHEHCVRDVSWHPYENCLVSSSWDSSLVRWSHVSEPDPEDMDICFADSKFIDEDERRVRREILSSRRLRPRPR